MTEEEKRKKEEEEAKKRVEEAKRKSIQAAAQAASKTKKPSGLAIKRNGDKFTCSWKIADADYGDGQVFHYFTDYGGYKSAVTAKQTSKTVDIDVTKYHPSKLNKVLLTVGFNVRGNRKKYKTKKQGYEIEINPPLSDRSFCDMDIKPPLKPSVSASLSSTYNDRCSFTWNAPNSSSNKYWCRGVEWESLIIRDCSASLPPSSAWKSSALYYEKSSGNFISTKSGSVEITERSREMSTGSFTRFFRVRARGPAGDSAWAYAKHVYARPYKAIISSASVKKTQAGGYNCTVKWTAKRGNTHPIDAVVVQYAFATPDAGLQCPDGASWRDVLVLNDSPSTDAATFSLDAQVGTDQCLFIRVNTEHDKKNEYGVTYGTPYMVAAGALTPPTNLEVTLNQETMLAVVSAQTASSIPDAERMVRYFTAKNPSGVDYGIIPHGEASKTVQLPIADKGKNITLGVYAVVMQSGKIKMKSAYVKGGGNIPVAPANVRAVMTDIAGTVQVTWDWSWTTATSAELSWADHEDAWESTDEPSTYAIDNTHVGRWNISGLETGKTWYIRVRLATGTGDTLNYGAYSDIVSIDLSSAPSIPVLDLSTGVVTNKGKCTASWTYSTSDGTSQSYAEVAQVVEGNYTLVATSRTAQRVTLDIKKLKWQTGTTHALAVRVTSASGRKSEWSDPVYLTIADPITATIASTSLVSKTVVEDTYTRDVLALTELPLTVTVAGAGGGGQTSVIIERADSYHVDRPDETEFNGFEGETIAYKTYRGEAAVEFAREDLVGHLDDGARYRIIATCNDSLGQSAEAEMEFEVIWDHQATAPEAQVVIDPDEMIAKLTPVAPDGALGTDVCDIYRLSVDHPELIYSNAEFGETYVDPFPAIGEFGGHRFVLKTAYGDYITADNSFAWLDTGEAEGDIVSSDANIINFGSDYVEIEYDVDLSNQWKKEFNETKYLGGAVQGDWNAAVSRTGSLGGIVTTDNPGMIAAIRRLANYAGVCHVRTKDGSSYSADVQVSESYSQDTAHKLVSFSLAITRVDSERADGVTLAEWRETHPEEEET